MMLLGIGYLLVMSKYSRNQALVLVTKGAQLPNPTNNEESYSFLRLAHQAGENQTLSQAKIKRGGRRSHQLEIDERRLYHPEITNCPICGKPLRLRSYLNWRKTIQTLSQNLYVSSRGAFCDQCGHDELTYLSAKAAHLSLKGSTYGLDVVVKIGYLRDYLQMSYFGQ